MRGRPNGQRGGAEWTPIDDPDSRFSSGIADFDRLLGGGFSRGSCAIFSIDESVGLEDLDLLLYPTFLNFLYHSRGIIAVLPSRDTPHGFRGRLTRFATRRRFDSRVRVVDYVGEDEGLSYVVNIGGPASGVAGDAPNPKARERAFTKLAAAEKAAQGGHGRSFIELTAFEVFETLMGTETALKMYYQGIKRARSVGNLVIGVLGPGLGCAAGVRRMTDTEFSLRREDVGLVLRGVRPAFSAVVVIEDPDRGAPFVSFVPRPA